MRIFTATLVTETNTFSPFATDQASFDACGISWRREDYSEKTFFTENVLHVKERAEADGHEVVLGLSAYADPGGPTLDSVYEHLRDDMLRQIETEGPFDAINLTLHGAMVASGYDDCEGDLLGRIRGIVGAEVFLGAMLDPHCHLTRDMVRAADALISMREYPHTDGADRLDELHRLSVATIVGEVRPAAVLVDCRMVGVWPTTKAPFRALVDRMQQHERDSEILSVSFAHGFPWGDVAESGARILVIGDGRIDIAERVALEIADDVRSLREEARFDSMSIEDALDRVGQDQGLLVLADIADNPGGGAPGDSTFILRALLDRGLSRVALGMFHDPDAVACCRAAGTRGTVEFALGGKHGAVSGNPVMMRGRVMGFDENHLQSGPGGAPIPLGPSAWVRVDGNDIIVTTSRHQVIHPDAFMRLGVDLAALDAVVVKSTTHFRSGFQPIARTVLDVATPGALSPEFANIDYRKKLTAYWPRCETAGGPDVILRKSFGSRS
ncbi:M81 family metallopeptidase [Sphingosinicella rhizophila]|uniref:Microcystinase C n=1 Tax=Sphingosinicella rhizophila TaxID=3050082 RepID=A0ABU3Q4Z3_9SPHN|nr:M81 family metallopeptidase [Sphingosinicella sp. GR2756]MDT9598485.1 M81 family metallopeptidase [Sphingosinicella sp. GR2756]